MHSEDTAEAQSTHSTSVDNLFNHSAAQGSHTQLCPESPLSLQSLIHLGLRYGVYTLRSHFLLFFQRYLVNRMVFSHFIVHSLFGGRDPPFGGWIRERLSFLGLFLGRAEDHAGRLQKV